MGSPGQLPSALSLNTPQHPHRAHDSLKRPKTENCEMSKALEIARKALQVALQEGAREEPERPKELKIFWNDEVKAKFILFMKSKRRPAGDKHIERCVRLLDKYIPPEGISTPEQVFNIFMSISKGARHHFDRAFRNLLNLFRRIYGYDRDFIELLKDAIPNTKTGEDKWVPPEDLVIESLLMIKTRNPKYLAFWLAVLDSGCRPHHLIEGLFENFDPTRLEKTPEGFYKYRLNIERRTKHAWIAYLTPHTAELIMELHERGDRITLDGVDTFMERFKIKAGTRPDGKPIVMPLRPKYIRKFAYNMMRLNGIDKDVAMWLNGRTPPGVDPEHYADLELLADNQYPRYAEYLRKLKAKAGILA